MTLDEIRSFILVYETGSLAKAAEALHISAQGLGKSIKRLEGELGIELFTRSFSGVTPTESADFVYNSFKTVIKEADNVIRYAEGQRRRRQEHCLVGRDSALGDAVRRGIDAYNTEGRGPIVAKMVRGTEAMQAELFLTRSCDYWFHAEELDTLPHLSREPLCVLTYHPVVNARGDLGRRGEIGLDDLRGKTILTPNLTHTYTQLIVKRCQERGFSPAFREVDKDYIWQLLAGSDEYVFFVEQEVDGKNPPPEGCSLVSLNPPMCMTIVLQASHGEVDPLLLAHIRTSLRSSGYSL